MLKRKLARKQPQQETTTRPSSVEQKQPKHDEAFPTDMSPQNLRISSLFTIPLWKHFHNLEEALNAKLKLHPAPRELTHIYNPVEYASEIHCAYLQRYVANRTRRLVFVGMNPGANGMGQTGVPFGNIATVRDVMQLRGSVQQPPRVHQKRSVQGLNCSIEEPSGERLWGLFARLAGGSLDTFSQQCFVHNFCPLIFFDAQGRNITPNELKGDYKTTIRDECLATLDEQLELLKAEIVVAVGDYVHQCLKHSRWKGKMQFFKLAHPSPRSLNNHNWPEKAEKWLQVNQLLKYMRNE